MSSPCLALLSLLLDGLLLKGRIDEQDGVFSDGTLAVDNAHVVTHTLDAALFFEFLIHLRQKAGEACKQTASDMKEARSGIG